MAQKQKIKEKLKTKTGCNKHFCNTFW